MSIEPVVLFFLLGVVAGLARSDLKIPGAIYEALSIFLLLAIGLKGGIKLAEYSQASLLLTSIAVVGVGAVIPLVAFPVLRYLGRMNRADAASIAAHYGSVSVVTFSVAVTFIEQLGIPHEGHIIIYLVLLEFPALMIGVFLARFGEAGKTRWDRLFHEVFFGKSILLLIGGLLIGYLAGPEGIAPLDKLFFDLFKGMLAFFLLEMGLVAASRIADLRRHGVFLVSFALIAPVLSALLGIYLGRALGLSEGGAFLLGVLYASASYIAAPTAMRIAVPEANPALSIGASLGATFPFNIFLGIPLYWWFANLAYRHSA